jgi:hypothetical protein
LEYVKQEIYHLSHSAITSGRGKFDFMGKFYNAQRVSKRFLTSQAACGTAKFCILDENTGGWIGRETDTVNVNRAFATLWVL